MPDRPYYTQLAERIGGNRACLALACKLLKRSYHLLKKARRTSPHPRRLKLAVAESGTVSWHAFQLSAM